MALVDRNRPKNFDDIVGQDKIVEKVKRLAERKDDKPPNMLFVGPAGCGKTTMAIAFTKHRYGDDWKHHFVEMNASDERGIQVVREKIKKLSTLAGERVIFLSEADNMTNDAQEALRRITEKSRTTIFIFDGNNEMKIIDPIKSRNSVFKFKRIAEADMKKVVRSILKKEGVAVVAKDKDFLELIVKSSKGDLRKCLNTLEPCIDFENKVLISDVIEDMETTGKEVLDLLNKGKFAQAKNKIENAYISAGWDAQRLIDEMYEHVGVFENPDVEQRVYYQLGQLNRDIPIVNNQLVAVMAFANYVMLARFIGEKDAKD